MILNLVVLVAIVLLTAYLANQGVLSSMLIFVTASFASILSMGLFEFAMGPIAGWRPAFARGVTFLILYMVLFFACRTASDMLVPETVKLKRSIDAAAGGVIGFFASLVIVGTTLIGIEMLPLHTSILGYDRFPQGMQATESNIWFLPERFTLAIWNGASGRGLGGAKAFGSVHPDLPAESYGYRNVVEYGSNPTLMDSMVTAKAWLVEPGKIGVTEGASKAVVVRLEIKRDAADTQDNYFRITPTQVRLVTDRGQRYPIGHMEKGIKFESTPLDSGRLFDDVQGDTVTEDWVYAVEPDENVQFVEVKQLARLDLAGRVTDLKDKPFPQASLATYSVRKYKQNTGTIEATVRTDSGPVAQAQLIVVLSRIDPDKIRSQLRNADKNAPTDEVIGDAPWLPVLGQPGVPDKGQFSLARRRLVNMLNVAKGENVAWMDALPALLISATKPNGPENYRNVPQWYKDNIEPLLNSTEFRRASGTTSASGQATLENVAAGEYCVITCVKTADGVFAWAEQVKVNAKGTSKVDLTTANVAYSFKAPK